MANNTALIAGVGGMCGSNMAVTLHALGWQVIGISRSDPKLGPWLRHQAVDLLDAEATRARSRGLPASRT